MATDGDHAKLAWTRIHKASMLSLSTRMLSERAGVDESIRLYRLLDALRSSNIQEIDASLNSNDRLGKTCLEETTTPLHIAVQCASLPVIDYLLEKNTAWINQKDQNGNTPLHLAALYGREQVVSRLISLDTCNDTILNKDGLDAFYLARTAELSMLIQIERQEKTQRHMLRLHHMIDSNDNEGLRLFLSFPGVAAHIDLNAIDSTGGATPLTKAAQLDSPEMIKLLLDNGADPTKCDSKGRFPFEITRTNSTKTMLRDYSKKLYIDTNLDANLSEHIKMKGYLKKWTNMTKGYRLRWFVLQDGVLAYYKTSSDTESECRGSICLKSAELETDNCKPKSFVIRVKNSRTYTLKTVTAAEADRWIGAICAVIRQSKNDHHLSPSSSLSNSSCRQLRFLYSPIEKSRNLKINKSILTEEESEVDGTNIELEQEPHKDKFEATAASVKIQLELLEQVLNTLVTSTAESSKQTQRDEITQCHKLQVSDDCRIEFLRDCFLSLHSSLGDLFKMSNDRETYWHNCLNYEREIRRLWEENMEALAVEQQTIETNLKHALHSKRFTKQDLSDLSSKMEHHGITIDRNNFGETVDEHSGMSTSNFDAADLFECLSDSDDESGMFFDAEAPIEVLVNNAQRLPIVESDPEFLSSFNGYERPLRTKLMLANDDRPKMSLWSILKNLIGKDMTRMTLPVTFNECTSLLQRVAEDLEYTDLLESAYQMEDSADRMSYVAAFAASEYASTINRIAKPFNPLLHETFEYARKDKGYRFIIEQVSHHPPISCAYAESPHWQYWGESKVHSKFTGKSFDINPLGTWHLHLHPACAKSELYTWKKVNTAVVGIMTGKPTVDNYGQMVIENKSTGDVCKLDFKSRGWTSRSAYQVRGYVCDKNKVPMVEIVGAWNECLIARKFTDTSTGSPSILWQVHDRPPAPFNLSPFAITLNELTPELLPWLPPTDTRFRPDQRAMEEGQYELAATEKERLEEIQRKRRRARQLAGEDGQGLPRWFKNTPKGWEFTHEYWKVRDDVGQRRENGEVDAKWPDTEDIF